MSGGPSSATPAEQEWRHLADHLVCRGLAPDSASLTIRPLTGGVSNDVLAVDGPGLTAVAKRALGRLRVAEEWLADPGRIDTEGRALQVAGELIPGSAPAVLDLDDGYLVIERAPDDWRAWKADLLDGHVDDAVAATLGAYLGDWQRLSSRSPAIAAEFADQTAFGQLRVDPFHRTVAERHPDLRGPVEQTIDVMEASRVCLVHGDYTPKNVLVGSGPQHPGPGVWVIDWEVTHWGDPAFDPAWLVGHLILKAVHRPDARAAYTRAAEHFLTAYRARVAGTIDVDEAQLVRQLGCLLLARVDGKSPVDYLSDAGRETTRRLARAVLHDPPATVSDTWELLSWGGGAGEVPRGIQHHGCDAAIDSLLAWEALDSRGKPTVACEVRLRDGSTGTATVPSGASTGTHEARELRDGDERYAGQGVRRAVANVMGELAGAVRGLDATDQRAVDDALRAADGTDNLGRLGVNAALSVSVAAAIAGARSQRLPLYAAVLGSAPDGGATPLLPLPMVNIVSGGAHAGRSIDVQDFLVVPVGARSFAEAIEWAARVRAGTAEVLAERGLPVALVADEGGLGPALPTNKAALEIVTIGIERAGLRPGDEIGIAIDVAATQFVDSAGRYVLATETRELTSAELVEELAGWCAAYPIVSLEDALAEDDWAGWQGATRALGGCQLLGDDLFVTNPGRLSRGVEEGVANAVLVKPNQIGTLTTARDVVRQAHDAGYATVLSARSGETEDDWLSDLAVGWRTGQIKVGSTMRSERTAKWNRLLRLEAELGDRAEYAGAAALSGAAGSGEGTVSR